MEKIQLPQPTLIFTVGRPSSGKSHFVRALAPHLADTFLLDKDTINDSLLTKVALPEDVLEGQLFESDSPVDEYHRKLAKRLESYKSLLLRETADRNSETYRRHIRLQTYWAMLHIARDNLKLGNSVILDAPHIKEIKIGYFLDIVPQVISNLYRLKTILCVVPESILRERIKRRGRERDEYMFNEEAWKLDLEKEPIAPQEIEAYDHIVVDTSRPEKPNIHRTLEFLMR